LMIQSHGVHLCEPWTACVSDADLQRSLPPRQWATLHEADDHTYPRCCGPCVLVSSARQASADALDDAKKAFVHDDYSTAARLLPPYAARGDPAAQWMLGAMYHGGEGVPQSYDLALYWLTLAAAQGHLAAQHDLGAMYAKGEGVPQNMCAHTCGSISRRRARTRRLGSWL
jgi:TPR repeat protein